MKNKQQWLIDAENIITEFAKTKIGKMSDKEFRKHEHQRYANQCANAKHAETGFANLAKNRTTEHQTKAGLAARDKHRSTGFFERFTKIGGEATQNKFKTQRLNRIVEIADVMEDDKSYSYKEMLSLPHGFTTKVLRRLLNDEDGFKLINKTASQGVAGTFKKI